MFKKGLRLPKNIRFTKENQISSNFFLIKIAENKTEYKRFAVVVSKRIDKRAVIRNKIKRQIRRCIEENKNDLPSGKDILMIVRPKIKDRQIEEICESVKKLFKKIK
ncbi:MAG: ribonuclease P protein component [Patescibacteria group bacterium]